MSAESVFRDIVGRLDSAGIPHMLTGSFAAAWHGAPRATQGILDVATIEDLIVAKLEWARIGGSERQIEDVAALIRLRGAELDRAYLDRWVGELGLVAEWNRAANLAG